MSHIEYLISTDNILALLLHSNLMKNLSFVDWFSIQFYEYSEVAYILGNL